MTSSTKRLFVLAVLAMAAVVLYLVVRDRGPEPQSPAQAPPAPVEQPAPSGAASRPLDNDFRAAMERDSRAAAVGSDAGP